MPRSIQPLTPEEIEKYDAVLEKTDGTFTSAAKILGINKETLRKRIEKTPSLKAKWGTLSKAEKDPAEDGEMHRPLVFSPEEQKALAEAKESAQLQKGFRKLGYDDEQIAFLADVGQLSYGSLDCVLDLTIGGMTKTYTDLLLLIKKLQDKLSDVLENPDNYYEEQNNGAIIQTPHKVAMDLTDRINELGKEMRHINTAAEQGRVTRYKIDEIRAAKEEEQKGKPRKPGWNPFGPTNFIQNNYGRPEKKAEDVETDG